MKKTIFLFLAVILTSAAFADNKVSDKVVQAFRAAGLPVATEGVAITDFTLPYLDGTNFTLSKMSGKAVFLNFWATWCPPCRAEMPSMESLYQKLKSKGFEMIAVNLRESKEDVSSFMSKNKLSFPSLLDARGSTGARYNVRAIPTTYIIDKRGVIISRIEGSRDWDKAEVIAAFEVLLGE
uniref:Redoxin domain protein n=1 Tax=uncultured bacterium contig00043 TaxID=1181530 RepID=A0A806KHY2_9BACT|nr:redoxin domain protein [uncultured bacterium contig00043]